MDDQIAAQQDEQMELERAMLGYLRDRVVQLNLEIRKRDARIAELEARLVEGETMTVESEV